MSATHCNGEIRVGNRYTNKIMSLKVILKFFLILCVPGSSTLDIKKCCYTIPRLFLDRDNLTGS